MRDPFFKYVDSKSFLFQFCSYGAEEKYCCVVGRQRCCDLKSYNEDQSKILSLILEAEERANSADKDSKSLQNSSAKSKLKETLIICAACVFGVPLLVCFVDCLINVSQKLRQRMFRRLSLQKTRKWRTSVSFGDEEAQAEVEREHHGVDKNIHVPEAISEREETITDDGASRNFQGPARVRHDSAHLDLVPGSSNLEQQNLENNATTLSKLEIELIKAQCAKMFQDEKMGKIKLAETQAHSNSAHNLPHKYGRFVVDSNRACNSERTSPTLPHRGKRKSSLVTSQTMGPLVINDHIEVMTLGNRSANHSFHNHLPKNGGPWNFRTLPHSSSSDHVLTSEAAVVEVPVGCSRKSESPARNMISPLYSLEQKDAKPLFDCPKKEIFNQIPFESTANSEDLERLSQNDMQTSV